MTEYLVAFAVGSLIGLALGTVGLCAWLMLKWRWLT
jgi:hypothetical protein